MCFIIFREKEDTGRAGTTGAGRRNKEGEELLFILTGGKASVNRGLAELRR